MDALSQTVVAELVREKIEGLIDQRKWKSGFASERRDRQMQRWTV